MKKPTKTAPLEAQPNIQMLIDQLDDLSVVTRERASTQLLTFGPAIIDPLVAVIHKETVRQCWMAAGVLAKMDDPRCVQPMIEALRSPHPLVCQMAAIGLGRYGDQRAVPALIERLHEPGGIVQVAVVNALSQLGDRRAVPALVEELKVTLSSTVRYTIIQALGVLAERHDQTILALIESFQTDADHHVRERVSEALANLI